MSFFTVARMAELEDLIKASRFIAWVARAKTVEEATAFLEEARARYPDASHHTWAYRIGDAYRFSDDGEPGGTAGRPMLEVLTRRDLNEVMAVVTRFFGGTKLGAGGLVRAYSGTLAKALDAAGVVEVKPQVRLRVAVPFAEMDTLHRLLDEWPLLTKGAPEYTAEGMRLELLLLEEDVSSLREQLEALTRGSANLIHSLK